MHQEVVMKAKKPVAKTTVKGAKVCVICGHPATENVDGEPSCREHVELVYENQVEDEAAKKLGYKTVKV